MCKLLKGSSVQTNADLQNLITSMILRQTACFSVEDVCSEVYAEICDGSDGEEKSAFVGKDSVVNERCQNTIKKLYLIDCLKSSKKGQYRLAMGFPAMIKR